MRHSSLLSLMVLLAVHAIASAQSPGILYTWAATDDTQEWVSEGTANFTTLTNTTAGQITVVEMGDELDPNIVGGPFVIRDGFNRRLESSTAQGGLDLTGLESIEIDLQHNGIGDVNVQFFVQARPQFDYVWAGSNGALNGPDFTLGPGMHTLEFPLSLLTPAQQAYIRTIGVSVRDHFDQGNLTWDVFEVRSTGTPLTVRDLATHDAGTSDNGLQGAFGNFELAAIVGNDGGQNQTGLSHNAALGSLQWTDKGNGGVPAVVSGAAVTWGNGTVFEGNGFNERLSDFSNYDKVTFRVSATDPTGGGGQLGIQGFFQTGNFEFQVAGVANLPIDGQFYDLVFPLGAVTDRTNTQFVGLNLFSHANDLTINVDLVRFEEVVGVPGDYNEDGRVDAADYTVWRDKQNATVALPNENPSAATPGVVDQEDFDFWKANFGNGTVGTSTGAVPEPASVFLTLIAAASALRWHRRQ